MSNKKQKNDSTLSLIWETLKEKGTNLKFMVTAFTFQGLTGNLDDLYFQNNDQVYILGQKIDTSQSTQNLIKQNKMFGELFQQIIWITYRKNFQELIPQQEICYNPQEPQNTSDNGWGCMIRAGQMIYAEALRRFLYKQGAHRLQPYQLIPIVLQFTDCEDSAFSIQNIAREGNLQFDLLPGDWYTPNRICYVLKQIHERKQKQDQEENERKDMLQKYNQEQNEWKEPNIGKLLFYNQNNDTPLILEKIIQKFCGKQAKLCSNPEHQPRRKKYSEDDCDASNLRNSVQDTKFQILNNQNRKQYPPIVCKQCHQSDKSMVLFISCRIGIEYPQPEYIEVLKKLMELKYSIGVVGGRPKQALYFPGRINDQLLYLDPHFVQNGTTLKSALSPKIFKTYFTNKLQTYLCYDIDSSLAFGYYFENLDEFEAFYQELMYLKEQDNNFFIWVERVQPDYLDDSEDEEQELQRRKRMKKKKLETIYQSSSDYSIIESDKESDDLNSSSVKIYNKKQNKEQSQFNDSICIFSDSKNLKQEKDKLGSCENENSADRQLENNPEEDDIKIIDGKEYINDYQNRDNIQKEIQKREEMIKYLRGIYNYQDFETLNNEWDMNMRNKQKNYPRNQNSYSFGQDLVGNPNQIPNQYNRFSADCYENQIDNQLNMQQNSIYTNSNNQESQEQQQQQNQLQQLSENCKDKQQPEEEQQGQNQQNQLDNKQYSQSLQQEEQNIEDQQQNDEDQKQLLLKQEQIDIQNQILLDEQQQQPE